MKLLQLHAEFKLSDDFDGTFSDALREMADYCESSEASDRRVEDGRKTDTKKTTIFEWQKLALKSLVENNNDSGVKAVYDFYLGDWS